MSGFMRKTDFAYVKTKVQISFATQIVQFLYFLNLVACFVIVQASLCQIWWETPKSVFLVLQLI